MRMMVPLCISLDHVGGAIISYVLNVEHVGNTWRLYKYLLKKGKVSVQYKRKKIAYKESEGNR